MKVYMGPYPRDHKTKRKINVRIDNYDVWSMDNTLAVIILPMLKKLKAVKHGAPHTDDADVPKRLRSTSAPKKKNDWDTDKYFFKRWDYILDEIIWTFEQLNTNWEDQYHSGKSQLLSQAYDKDDKPLGKPKPFGSKRKDKEGATHFRLITGPKDTRVFDKKGHQKHYECIKAGLILFGKYYQCLWD